MRAMLDGDDACLQILRLQYGASQLETIKQTGVGFYAYFRVPTSVPRLGSISADFGDIFADNVEGLRSGLGFILWIKNGCLSHLECYTFNEAWPKKLGHYQLKYEVSGQLRGKESRDVVALTQDIHKKVGVQLPLS